MVRWEVALEVSVKLRSLLLTHVALFAAVSTTQSFAASPTGGYSWTGPYLGVEGGGGWGHSNQTDFRTTTFPACIATSFSAATFTVS